jgi:LysM repeat protein
MRRLGLVLMAVVALFGGVVDFVRAQLDCPVIVTQALSAIGDNCREMGRNTACYGYTLVDGTFVDEVPETYFSAPADRAELTSLMALRTSGMDESLQHWGIALMHVQADVPNLTPGQAVTFILMGDAEVENRVTPDEAIVSGQPITVSANRRLQVYESPSVTSLPVSVIEAGGALPADAIDATQTWVRVLIVDDEGENSIGWIERAAVESAGLDALPIIGTGRYTPMQAFYFSTGVGVPRCQQAPDAVTIRSPRDRIVTLNVNGADVRIGSTITFKTGANNTALITVQEGTLELPDGQIVPEGQTIVVELDDEETIIAVIEIRPATDEELGIGAVAEDAFAVYDGEAVVILEETTASDEVIHIVVSGDTLFSIALQYEASMPAIMERNNLDNPSRIFVGSSLVIPNVGSGYVGLPRTNRPVVTANPNDTNPPPNELGDCAGFVPTSPLDAISSASSTFYWDPIDVEAYRLTVINNETQQVQTHHVSAPLTTITIGTSPNDIGLGTQFSWYVEGTRGNDVVCTTRTVNVVRVSSLQASRECSGSSVAIVSWSGADDGVTIDYDTGGGTFSNFHTGSTGFATIIVTATPVITAIRVIDGPNIVALSGC